MKRIEERQGDKYFVSDPGDDLVLREVYEDNVYRAEPKPDYRVLDIGANKGIFSIWAAKRGAKVTAYEPNPETYGTLLRNMKLNGVNFDTHQTGVWSSGDGSIPFYPCTYNSGASSFYKLSIDAIHRANPVLANVVTLDEVLGSEHWDLVKIDAENSETDIILPSKKLDQIDQLSIEIHNPPYMVKLLAMQEKLEAWSGTAWPAQRSFVLVAKRKGL